MVFARFRAAHDELAAEKFLVVQFLHGSFCFIDRQHLDEGESFRALVVFISHDLRVLHRADAVEEFEEIALRRIDRLIPDVKPRCSYFD